MFCENKRRQENKGDEYFDSLEETDLKEDKMATNKAKKGPIRAKTFTVSKPGRMAAIFNEKVDENIEISDKLLQNAMQSGQLNLSARGLSKIPANVYNINFLEDEQTKNTRKHGFCFDHVISYLFIQNTRLFMNIFYRFQKTTVDQE